MSTPFDTGLVDTGTADQTQDEHTFTWMHPHRPLMFDYRRPSCRKEYMMVHIIRATVDSKNLLALSPGQTFGVSLAMCGYMQPNQ